jgi:hypothetical protein
MKIILFALAVVLIAAAGYVLWDIVIDQLDELKTDLNEKYKKSGEVNPKTGLTREDQDLGEFYRDKGDS